MPPRRDDLHLAALRAAPAQPTRPNAAGAPVDAPIPSNRRSSVRASDGATCSDVI